MGQNRLEESASDPIFKKIEEATYMLWNSTLWNIRTNLPKVVVAAMTAVDAKLNQKELGGGIPKSSVRFSHGSRARGLEMASRGSADGTVYGSSRLEAEAIH